MTNQKIMREELEKLEKYAGKMVVVTTKNFDYHFSESHNGERKIFCSAVTDSSFWRALRKVESNGIELDGGKAAGEHVPFASDLRYAGSVFLGGFNAETYHIEMIARIEAGGETIFQQSHENYMSDDMKEKCRTYTSVPLPPPMDPDE